MGWFDEQIKQRKLNDEEVLEETYNTLAGIVLGRKVTSALESNSHLAATAIGEVLKFYHIKGGELPENVTDINEQIEYIMRPYGIMRRVVRLPEGWYKDAVGPMLGTRADDGTVIALIPSQAGWYQFYDKTQGKTVRVNGTTQKLIDSEAIAFYKSFPLRKINIVDLFAFAGETLTVRNILAVLFTTWLATCIGLIMPFLNQQLFGNVIDTGSNRLLFSIASFMLCVIVSQSIFTAYNSLVINSINKKIEIYVEAATMMRVLSLPASFFKKYSSGELSSYTQYINSLCSMLVTVIMTAGLTSLFSLAYVGQIFTFAPALVVPSLIILLVTFAFTIVNSRVQSRQSKKIMESEAKDSGTTFALINGIQKIRLSGAEKRAFAKWGSTYSKCAKAQYDGPMLIKISDAISTAIALIGTIVMYYFAAASDVSIANYNAFTASYGIVSGAFMALAGIANTIAQIQPIIEMARPIMDAEPEISEGKSIVNRVSGSIELNGVSFKYGENMPNVIDNMNLKIKSGQYIAIVGKTGCGKSTLLRLLLGFEKPQKGAIYYDGHDLNTLDLKSLRRKIGVVMQSGKLFTEDIFSNIVISAPWLTLEDAWEAAEKAGIADDIRNMPMGMNTLIAEGAGGISGGQKQRLMIARAIAPKPRILMFDEATSALDNITQKQVSEALDALKCTRIVIAHRLSTIKQCDRIIVLEGGHIIEDGTYDELLSRNGFFADLVKRQMVTPVS